LTVTIVAMLGVSQAAALADAPSLEAAPTGSSVGHVGTAPSAGSAPLWGLAVSNTAVKPGVLESAMGQPFEAQGEYTPMSGWSYPFGSVQRAADNGARIYLNITSWHEVGGKKVCYPFRNYPSGQYDGMLLGWVNKLKAFDYADTFLTFNHEPTAGSPQQPSCGTAAQYKVAYDYVFGYFRHHGITYPFVWCMVASSFLNGFADQWQPPASDFDVMAVDGYNRDISGDWRTPEFIFTPAHNYARKIGKPLMMGEVGCVESRSQSTRKAAWITDAAALFRSWNAKAILWSDAKEYRPDSTARSLTAWVAAS
jgi:hypothetical protein